MNEIAINRCLNAAARVYGLSTFGVVTAALAMLVVWLGFSMPVGIMAAVPSYLGGVWIGGLWHKGALQQLIYRNLPLARLLGGNALPQSYNKKYW